MTKYLKEIFYSEVKNPKYIIDTGIILRETVTPKSLKIQHELIHNTKILKDEKVIQLENNELVLVNKNLQSNKISLNK